MELTCDVQAFQKRRYFGALPPSSTARPAAERMENMAFLIIETTVAGGLVCATLTRPNTISDICCVDRYSSA